MTSITVRAAIIVITIHIYSTIVSLNKFNFNGFYITATAFTFYRKNDIIVTWK